MVSYCFFNSSFIIAAACYCVGQVTAIMVSSAIKIVPTVIATTAWIGVTATAAIEFAVQVVYALTPP